MPMDVRRMLTLVEVGRAGSFTSAAEALNLTVSAVSQQISQLESEAGQALVQRRPRGIALTEAGSIVVRHAERIERLMVAAHGEVRELSSLRAGSLKLGTVPTVTESFLPTAISQFRSQHPAVRVTVHSTQQSGLSRLLESRDVELAITWQTGPTSDRETAIVAHPIFDDPSVLLVPAAHPLAIHTSARMEQLRQEQWIIRTSSSVLEVLNRACRLADFEPTVSAEARSYQEVQAMVAIGMGVALVPQLSAYSLRRDVRALKIIPTAPTRRIVLAQRAGDTLSPAATAMSRLLHDTGKEWQSGAASREVE